VQVAGMRSAVLGYSAAMNVWSATGRDDHGRLARASGIVGSSDVRSAAWPAPSGAEPIDAWAAAGTSTIAVQNNAGRQIDATAWGTRGSQQAIARTMAGTTCAADPVSERRLLCASWDGTATRIFALDVEIGVAGSVSSIDGQFRLDQPPTPGWVIGSLN